MVGSKLIDENTGDIYYLLLSEKNQTTSLMRNDTTLYSLDNTYQYPGNMSDNLILWPDQDRIFLLEPFDSNIVRLINIPTKQADRTLEISNLNQITFSPNKNNYIYTQGNQLFFGDGSLIADGLIGIPRFSDEKNIIYYQLDSGKLWQKHYQFK